MEDKMSFDDFKKSFKSVWKSEPLMITSVILAMLAGLLVIADKIRYLF